MTRYLGVVLAGGRSTRFGRDKADEVLDGVSLLDHAVATLEPLVTQVAIVGRRSAGRPWIDDWPSPHCGPLGGLCGALRYGAAARFDWVVTLPCDTPCLPPDLIRSLIARSVSCYVESMPVIGVWSTGLAAGAGEYLSADSSRSVRRWAVATGAVAVAGGVPIPNINRPEDLACLTGSRSR